jgi:hypothetical protein
MQIFAYVLLAILGLFVGWWVLKVSLGLFLPVERTARPYLLQLLRKAEINQVVPESCVKECVEESLKMAKGYAMMSGSKNHLRAELVKHLELQADMLRLWVRSQNSFDAVYQKHYKAMFERHGIPRLG